MRLNEVIRRFSLVSGLEGEDLSRYAPLCADAISQVKARMVVSLETLGDEDVRRLEACAAALGFYKYTLISSDGAVDSFEAGNLRVRMGENAVERAKMMLFEEQKAVSDIACFDDDFALKGVRI